MSASAATVIAAVLTLLLASFSFYSDLAWPFAIAVGVILLAGLTLLPALLSIRLSLLAVKRSLFATWVRQAQAAAMEHPGQRQARGVGPGGGAHRAASGTYPHGRRRALRRAGVRCARLHGTSFGGATAPPGVTARHGPCWPSISRSQRPIPPSLIFKFSQSVCGMTFCSGFANRRLELRASALFHWSRAAPTRSAG